ncbi:MAG: preprotein translocase subunit Sec61beta [archaeon]|jgi:preprotein translocase subunit Sec61beta
MKMNNSKTTNQSPSSAIGIMRFKENTGGPKMSPEVVIGIALGIAILVLVLRMVLGL